MLRRSETGEKESNRDQTTHTKQTEIEQDTNEMQIAIDFDCVGVSIARNKKINFHRIIDRCANVFTVK